MVIPFWIAEHAFSIFVGGIIAAIVYQVATSSSHLLSWFDALKARRREEVDDTALRPLEFPSPEPEIAPLDVPDTHLPTLATRPENAPDPDPDGPPPAPTYEPVHLYDAQEGGYGGYAPEALQEDDFDRDLSAMSSARQRVGETAPPAEQAKAALYMAQQLWNDSDRHKHDPYVPVFEQPLAL